MRRWGGLPRPGQRRRHLALAVIALNPPAAPRSRRPFRPGARAAGGTGDPRASAPALPRRALAGLPQQARAGSRGALLSAIACTRRQQSYRHPV
jgi:hypothetical protein